jgi:hypothetical protein
MYLEILQTALLIILVDRNFILRDRYKIAIENEKPYDKGKRYVAIWIYCKESGNDFYGRGGGRRLMYFNF